MVPDIPVPRQTDIDARRLDQVDRLGRELMRLRRLLARAGAAAAHARDGVEPSAYALLVHLVTDGPRRLSDLADAVRSDRSTVSRQVAALVRAGLVERRPDPADRRASRLVATEAGERTLRLLRRRRDAALADLLRGWEPDAVTTFTDLLHRFNTALDGYPAAGTMREGLR
jgi:DNA-binding MarR family transcriptional regulator